MYNKVQDQVFEGILTAALNEYIVEELKSVPSDEEIAEMYPTSIKLKKRYQRKAKEKKYQLPLPLVYCKRLAVAFFVVVTLSFGILMTNSDVRAAVSNTVVTWYEKVIQINFFKAQDTINTDKSTETEDSLPDLSDLKVTYIPSEFMLASSIEETEKREYIYTAEDGRYLVIGMYSSETTEVVLDIELTKYEEISINGNSGYLVYNEVENTGYLTYGNTKYTITISSISTKEEIIKIAENIK